MSFVQRILDFTVGAYNKIQNPLYKTQIFKISDFSKSKIKNRNFQYFRDFSRFSEERPLPHVVDFEAVTLSVVTPLCAFGALERVRITNFRALEIGTDPVHGLIF